MAPATQAGALDLWAALLADAGRLDKGRCFLDAGGGSGLLARSVSARSGSTGVLADPNAVAVPGIPAVCARASALPFSGGAFDAVILSHVLHHLGEPGRALTEAARVLAPGGRLLIRTASHADLLSLPHAHWMPGLLTGILQGIPDLPVIRGWLSAAGLMMEAEQGVLTPQDIPVDAWAGSVALLAFREWAMSPGGGPDPREAARSWAIETYSNTPAVPETLLVARKALA